MRKLLLIILFIFNTTILFAPNRYEHNWQALYWCRYRANVIAKEQFINNFNNKTIGNIIWETSKKYNLNQYFVKELVKIESQFYIYAKSKAGARGLMQLMYKTAKLLKPDITIKQLYNPYINIDLGCKLLAKLKQKHNNNWIKIIIEYNGGFRNIKNKRIPKETYLYIINIYKVLEQYNFNLDFIMEGK